MSFLELSKFYAEKGLVLRLMRLDVMYNPTRAVARLQNETRQVSSTVGASH